MRGRRARWIDAGFVVVVAATFALFAALVVGAIAAVVLAAAAFPKLMIASTGIAAFLGVYIASFAID